VGKSTRIRGLPWLLILEAAWTLRGFWSQLPKNDRAELARLLRKSRGLPHNLTARERSELRRIVSDLDLKSAAMQMAPIGRKLRKR
jgi:hypothetical protein